MALPLNLALCLSYGLLFSIFPGKSLLFSLLELFGHLFCEEFGSAARTSRLRLVSGFQLLVESQGSRAEAGCRRCLNV